MDKKKLSELDICTKYITPTLKEAGWNIHSQIREEVTLAVFCDQLEQQFKTSYDDAERLIKATTKALAA